MYGDRDTQFRALMMEKTGMAAALVVNVETGFQQNT
jgi:hypothetical protein